MGPNQAEKKNPRPRKKYTIKNPRQQWTPEEHARFVEAIRLYQRDWARVREHVGTRTVIQIRSHAQKYFIKLRKMGKADCIPPRRNKISSSNQLSNCTAQTIPTISTNTMRVNNPISGMSTSAKRKREGDGKFHPSSKFQCNQTRGKVQGFLGSCVHPSQYHWNAANIGQLRINTDAQHPSQAHDLISFITAKERTVLKVKNGKPVQKTAASVPPPLQGFGSSMNFEKNHLSRSIKAETQSPPGRRLEDQANMIKIQTRSFFEEKGQCPREKSSHEVQKSAEDFSSGEPSSREDSPRGHFAPQVHTPQQKTGIATPEPTATNLLPRRITTQKDLTRELSISKRVQKVLREQEKLRKSRTRNSNSRSRVKHRSTTKKKVQGTEASKKKSKTSKPKAKFSHRSDDGVAAPSNAQPMLKQQSALSTPGEW
eukprot:CAMPEP_0114496824 /NCGR_PEP_ID=MMETSP0109-20121206/5979_1 /TAXON_ID=29199 /ORGANISM="Chlorarachnion reptans, Strain CCCM449" /LENGTH=426 /DNA_ID=CAMNT_0001674129 /DNA_START=46 /DNA_END=1322 /DNA_ORIENTATION=-